jgi:hypothetical protein
MSMHRQDIQIPKPCDEPWENMSGCGAERHCARCDQSVYDLSEMSADEVEALLARPPQKLCVSYLSDEQGLIQLKRKPTNSSGLALALALSVAACSNPLRTTGDPPRARLGGSPIAVAIPPEPRPSALTVAPSASALSAPQPSTTPAKVEKHVSSPKLLRRGGAPVATRRDSGGY